jgi:pimeloyl-ACP methyl ester carboxylesterase
MYPAGESGIVVRRVEIGAGATLRVLEAGPIGSLTVVLVHGWAGSVYSFAETIPALVKAGYRVVAIDLPGHGLSDAPRDSGRYTVSAMTEAVATVLSECRVERYVLAAHSMAGAIALRLAARPDRRPAGLVLIGAVGVGRAPLAAFTRWITPAFVTRVLPPLLTRAVARLVTGIAFGTSGRPTSRDVDEYWAPTQFDGFSWALCACLDRADWLRATRERLRSLALPVLVVAGGRDRVVWGVAHGGRLIPGARVVEVPEAGHLVMQECAAVVNAALVSFLDPLTAARATRPD